MMEADRVPPCNPDCPMNGGQYFKEKASLSHPEIQTGWTAREAVKFCWDPESKVHTSITADRIFGSSCS